jgi:hypothetical protein
MGLIMNKLLATIFGGLLAVSAQAQTGTQTQSQMEPKAKPQPHKQAGSSASKAPIGQAVSGNNSTAAGVSGTGLHTDGTATTGTALGVTARQAAGVNKAGEVTSKSTAVVNAAPKNAASVNAQATNTTPPANKAEDAVATGGRGEAGTKAEREIREANTTRVKVPPGSRLKTEQSTEAGREKYAEAKEKSQRKSANRAAGGDTENR